MLDLANFETAAEKGAPLELKDPAGLPLTYDTGEMEEIDGEVQAVMKPITIWLAGVESPRWAKAADALTNKINDMKEKRSAQDIRVDRAAILAKMTLRWDGIVVDGKALECNEENAKKLYARFRWIMDQVDRFIAVRENFLPASSKN